MTSDEQFAALMHELQTVSDKQDAQGSAITNLQTTVLDLGQRVTTAEGTANDAKARLTSSRHDIDAADAGLARILDAQKREADARHAETVAQLVAVKQTGANAPIIRELRIGFTGLGLLASVVYLMAQHIVDATQAAILLPILAAGVATFVKSSSDKTRAEKVAAATIPPPALTGKEHPTWGD